LHKGLFMYRSATSDQKLQETFPELVAHLEGIEDMQLSGKVHVQKVETTGGEYVHWGIGNHRYTRKAFESIVKTHYLS